MALFTRDSIDRLRDAIDMVDLVGAKTDLRRVGSRWTGLCPFHEERTPSFSVNADEKLFYCFGCQAKGDAFGFVEQSEGLDFRESLELLADRYGVELELENDDPQAELRRKHRQRLLALLDLRSFMFERVYLGPVARADSARAAAMVEELFAHHLAGGDAQSATDWVAGMTDGYALRAHAELGAAERSPA